jgi:molecular chaperone IbpA
MAVAGFDRQDLQVEVKNNQIVVEGNKGFRNESSDIDYIYKGIASRHFRQSFALADHLEVTHAEFKDGILRITLKGEFLQEEPAHKIAID